MPHERGVGWVWCWVVEGLAWAYVSGLVAHASEASKGGMKTGGKVPNNRPSVDDTNPALPIIKNIP